MSLKRVALLVHTGNEWSRRVLMGIAQYASERGGWDFTHPKAGDGGEVDLPANWVGDGIICRLTSDQLRHRIRQSNIPAVNVSWLSFHEPRIAKVVSDEAACGQLVSDYFLERHFRNFAFIGVPPSSGYQSTIVDSVKQAIGNRGLDLHEFQFSQTTTNPHPSRDALRHWIEGIPKPVAVIAWDSEKGRILTAACAEAKIAVPEDVAIVCIEHDDLASSLSTIPLSNIDQDAWRVGFAAAGALDALMSEKSEMPEPISIPPISIVQRKSSASSAVDDPIVREAYRLIHARVQTGLNVDDLVREVNVSRRTLESRFKSVLGTSPGSIIRRARLDIVKRLLRETTLTIPQIADRAGFSYAEALIRAFKKETGVTPTEFRVAIES